MTKATYDILEVFPESLQSALSATDPIHNQGDETTIWQVCLCFPYDTFQVLLPAAATRLEDPIRYECGAIQSAGTEESFCRKSYNWPPFHTHRATHPLCIDQ